MKKEKREVKSKGEVVDTIEVPIYETLEEAIKASDKDAVLSAFNRLTATDLTNQARAAKTRTVSPAAQIARAAKSNPAIQAELDKILAKHGLK